ncbi:MAG: hypothetical protein BWY07_01468 [Candidatus Hydrogenedentes bacterium ADurb.Bin170]|nr:MAG: hypothetical protein BWY07_01468 [Candidatus Hydrogenedentes bacterium ADurb.Bin170]
MRLPVAFIKIMAIVCGNRRKTVLLCHFPQHGIDTLFLGHAVVHHFDVYMVVSENTQIGIQRARRLFLLSLLQQ